MKKVLVIIVTFNGLKWADKCFTSLRKSDFPVDVFVVDNGSSDGTPEYVREHFPEVKLYCTGENYGFGKANNIGLEYALSEEYDYVYLLNQDAWVQPDTISCLVEAMEADPSYGILSPLQMTASMTAPDPRFAAKCLDRPVGTYLKGRIYDVPFVMAAHWLISRRCVETVGGFSPAFRHYGEDDNYIHRAVYHGFKVGFCGGVHAVHDRDMRPCTRTSAMRLKCVASVVKVSNPLNCPAVRAVLQPLELLAISVIRLSTDVLLYIPAFVRSLPKLLRLRKESMGRGAFLDGTMGKNE